MYLSINQSFKIFKEVNEEREARICVYDIENINK